MPSPPLAPLAWTITQSASLTFGVKKSVYMRRIMSPHDIEQQSLSINPTLITETFHDQSSTCLIQMLSFRWSITWKRPTSVYQVASSAIADIRNCNFDKIGKYFTRKPIIWIHTNCIAQNYRNSISTYFHNFHIPYFIERANEGCNFHQRAIHGFNFQKTCKHGLVSPALTSTLNSYCKSLIVIAYGPWWWRKLSNDFKLPRHPRPRARPWVDHILKVASETSPPLRPRQPAMRGFREFHMRVPLLCESVSCPLIQCACQCYHAFLRHSN